MAGNQHGTGEVKGRVGGQVNHNECLDHYITLHDTSPASSLKTDRGVHFITRMQRLVTDSSLIFQGGKKMNAREGKRKSNSHI